MGGPQPFDGLRSTTLVQWLFTSEIYPILDSSIIPTSGRAEFLRRLGGSLAEAGVTLLEYRNKTGAEAELLADCQVLRGAMPATQVKLILDDRADLVVQLGFDGVHVDAGDVSPAEARRLLGSGRIVARLAAAMRCCQTFAPSRRITSPSARSSPPLPRRRRKLHRPGRRSASPRTGRARHGAGCGRRHYADHGAAGSRGRRKQCRRSCRVVPQSTTSRRVLQVDVHSELETQTLPLRHSTALHENSGDIGAKIR